jgi:hypothetical protein
MAPDAVAIGATGVAVIVASAVVSVVADPMRAAIVGSLVVSAASAANTGTANKKRLNHEARTVRAMRLSPEQPPADLRDGCRS